MSDRSRPRRNTLGADLQKRGRALFTCREQETQEFLTTLQALQLGESADVEVNRVFNVYGQGGAVRLWRATAATPLKPVIGAVPDTSNRMHSRAPTESYT